MIPKPRDISYEMRLKNAFTRNQEFERKSEVFKILNGYENIDRKLSEIFVSRVRKREGLEDMELH